MKMPEGWERLNNCPRNHDSFIHTIEIRPALDLMKEMYEILTDLLNQCDVPESLRNKACDISEKFENWK